jgi:hypothetical protein
MALASAALSLAMSASVEAQQTPLTAGGDVTAEEATPPPGRVSDTLFKSVKLSSAVFYSDLENSIQNAFSGPNGNNSIVIYNADGDNCGRTRPALRQAFSSARSKNLRDEPSSQGTI